MDLLWKYLEDNQLTIDTSTVNAILKCAICSKIMKQSKITACGCTFCQDCIKNYLGEETKQCPACVKDNVISELSYNNDVTDCRKSNKEIPRSIVMCPLNGCDVSCELQLLLKHMISCKMNNESCILKDMGCMSKKMNGGMMEKHMREELKMHFQLVSDNLSVVRNWMDSLQVERTESNRLRQEVSHLGAENADIQSAVSEISVLRTDNSHMHQMISALETKIEQITSRNKLTEDAIRCLREENAVLKSEMTQIVQENREKICDMKGQKSQARVTENENIQGFVGLAETKDAKQEEMTQENAGTKNHVDDIEENGRGSGGNLENSENVNAREDVIGAESGAETTSQLGLATAEQFHWTPKQLSPDCQDIHSDDFTFKGYKLSMSVNCGKPNNIGVCLFLRNSTDDSTATWPMQLRLRLRLADADSGNEVWFKILDCNEDRPDTNFICMGKTGEFGIYLGDFGMKTTDSFLISLKLL